MLVLYCGFLVVLVLLVCLPLRLVSAMLLRDCGLGYCLFVGWSVLFDCVCDCFGGEWYCLLLLLFVGIMIDCLWFTCCRLGFVGADGCGYICIVLCCLLWLV